MKHRRHSWPTRGVAALLALALTLLGCPPDGEPMSASPGRFETERDAWIAFRYGHVNAIGGNLNVRRVDLSIDTRIGTVDIGATWDSADTGWRFSFDSTYDGVFVDPTGARYDMTGLSNGEAYPGSGWVKTSASSVMTKGGLLHVFGAGGRLDHVRWQDGLYPRLVHVQTEIAGEPRTTEVLQCTSPTVCGSVYTVAYDGIGRVVAVDDRAGRRAEFTWGAAGLVGARNGLDFEEDRPGWSYEYEAGALVAMTNGEDERTELGYEDGRVATVRDVGDATTGDPEQTFYYGDKVDGMYATRHWDALGNERRFRYDGNRRLHEVENVALGDRTTWTWQGSRPATRTTPAGVTTRWTWSQDDLATEIQPSGNVLHFTYAADAVDEANPRQRPLARIEDSLGLVEARTYDAQGRLASIENGAGEITRVSYTGEDEPIVDLPSGVRAYYSDYGEHGHPTLVGSFPFTGGRTVYDTVGNLVEGSGAGQPEIGGVQTRGYDAARNLRSLGLEGGERITVEVRSDGLPTAVRRPGGADHEMDYDALGRLVARRERVDGQWQTTAFELDALGRTQAIQRPNGMRQEFTYDAAGQLTGIANLRDSVEEGTLTMAWSGGRPTDATDSIRGTTESFVYDSAGRRAATQHGDGTETWVTRDLRSRLTEKAYVLEDQLLLRAIGYTYDGANRTIELLDGETVLIERVYALGQRAELRYGNGLTRTFTYEPQRGLLEGTETVDASGAIVESTSIAHELLEPEETLRTTVQTTTWGGVEASTSEEYALSPFDATGVVRGIRLNSHGDGTETRELTWDPRSNLLAEGTTTFSYNGEGNRLLSMSPQGGPTTAYAYDAAGFTTERAGKAITWAANGRMTSHGSDSFTWDVSGRALSSRVDGVETTALFDGSVRGDADGVPVGIDLGAVALDLTTGARLYRHDDFRGNVKFSTDDDGAVRAHYAYSAYRVEAVHGAGDDPVRFVGRAEIGELMILGERIYDPASGRFLSPDPLFNPLDQYAYTHANPIWFSDRNGLASSLGVGADILELLGTLAFALSLVTTGGLAVAFLTLAAIYLVLAAILHVADDFHVTPEAATWPPPKALKPLQSAPEIIVIYDDASGDTGGEGDGGGGSGDGEALAGVGCSPSTISQSGTLPYALAVLLPLQALLGLLVLRRRRSAKSLGANERAGRGEHAD